MADNVTTSDGTIATDEINTLNGVAQSAPKPQVQRIKLGFGPDGTHDDVETDNGLPVQAVGELIEVLEAQRVALMALTRTIGQSMPDVAGRLRVAIDAISASLTLATITTVGTVTTVSTVSALTNQTSMGGFSATEQIPALMRAGGDALRSRIQTS